MLSFSRSLYIVLRNDSDSLHTENFLFTITNKEFQQQKDLGQSDTILDFVDEENKASWNELTFMQSQNLKIWHSLYGSTGKSFMKLQVKMHKTIKTDLSYDKAELTKWNIIFKWYKV